MQFCALIRTGSGVEKEKEEKVREGGRKDDRTLEVIIIIIKWKSYSFDTDFISVCFVLELLR